MFVDRRWRTQLLAGVAMLLGGLLVGLLWSQRPVASGSAAPPPDVEAALAEIFDGDVCVTAAQADTAVRNALRELGRTTWTVRWGAGVQPENCVGWDVDEPGDVLLLPAMDPAVRSALKTFRLETYVRCLTEAQVTAELTALLEGLGEEGFEIRPDGPVGGPLDRVDEITKHVEAGCFIYATTGISEAGRRIYWIAGAR